MEKRDFDEEEKLIGPASASSSSASASSRARRGASIHVAHTHTREKAWDRRLVERACGAKGCAVIGCFKAWAFANPRRFLACVGCIIVVIALSLYKLLHHPPAPPSPWRAQCRPDFPTHYALRPPGPDSSAGGGDDWGPPPPPPPPPPAGHHHPHGPPKHHSHLSPEDIEQRQAIHSIQPLTVDHPAWPYTGDSLPSLASADDQTPVGVFVGVFTMDGEAKRRHLIRSTYASHRESRTRGTEGVEVVFVMGRPKEEFAAEVALEQRLFGDLVILDIEENMNDGKTHAFFAWAAEHARVPNCRWPHHDQVECEGKKQPDYVVKADDDSFIVLGELERRLRIAPRQKTYWGLLMYGGYLQFAERSEYMAGEGYALSMDLVKFVATSPYALEHLIGDEDQRVGDWLRAHPEAETIVWITERCWMYDHPKAGKLLSHGFMFPDVHRAIQSDSPEYLPPHLPREYIDIWSTVSPYNAPYTPPGPNMTIEQQMEALFEGSPLSMLHKHNRPYNPRRDESIEAAWRRRPTREQRMKGAESGSTVLVHKVRRDDWWLETALALLGPEA